MGPFIGVWGPLGYMGPLRRESATVRFLESRVLMSLMAWMSVCCECCVLSGTGLCVGLITRPGKSYLVVCVCVIQCDQTQQ